MRWAHVSFVFLAAGAVACTALLGDFNVGGSNGGPGDDGGNDGSSGGEGGLVTITPPDAKMGILRAQQFTASEPVTWSLQEPNAGVIDDKGNYFSGGTPATYHVIATAKSDPSRKATVPIVVTNLAIGIVVGQNGGQGNIDGIPSKAHFNSPRGIAHLNDQGANSQQYFIADTQNHTIRMYDTKSGKVTTVAGTAGLDGSTDGVGAAARFTQPDWLAMDPSGKKLYVNDHNGTCIRVVDVNGTYAVTTLAGTCGTSGNSDGTPGTPPTPAQLSNVRALAVSGDRGSFNYAQPSALYVCDGGNRMRRIELAAASSRGVAKDMFAGGIIGSCSPMAVDYWSGNGCAGAGCLNKKIWFADGSGNRLKRFNEPSSVAVLPYTTVAAANLQDVAPLPDQVDTFAIASGSGGDDDVYATNNNKSVIYRYHGLFAATGTFDAQPWAGSANDRRVVDGNASTGRLAGPQQLDYFEGYGKLMVADSNGDAIREIQTFNQQMTTPIGAAHVIDRVDGPKTSARVTGPFSVAADENEAVYFGDLTFDDPIPNNTIRKFDRTTATVTTLTGLPTRPFDPATPPTDGPKDQSRFWFPLALTYAKGKLYVIDNLAQAVRGVDVATGTVATIAGELKVPGNNDGIGVAAHFKFVDLGVSGSGGSGPGILGGSVTTDGTNLYVSDAGNFSIRKIVIATGETTTIAGGVQGPANGTGKNAQFVFPLGLTFDNGNLYICDWQDHTIRRMNLATGVVDGFIGLSGQQGDKDGDAATATLNSPFRLQADGLGNLYVAELPLTQFGQPNGVIRRIDIAKRTITSFAGTPGQIGLQAGQIPSTLNCPTSLALTAKKDLIFGDFCDATIAIFQPL